MADTTKQILSLIATNSSRIRELPFKDGNLIFIQDLGRIAFDFKGNRVFYNQIVELDTEEERLALENPLNGYYFTIDEACLWAYKNGKWIQITDKPQEIVFVGVELPELGQKNKIYANTTEGAESISVWDDELGYVVVADKTYTMTPEDVIAMFNKK